MIFAFVIVNVIDTTLPSSSLAILSDSTDGLITLTSILVTKSSGKCNEMSEKESK
jgi:Co/Zn/Cd efflux system component